MSKRTFTHSGASIYAHRLNSAGQTVHTKWLASTQQECGVAPSPVQVADAAELTRMLDAFDDLLAACKAMQSVLRAWPTTGKDLGYELRLAQRAIKRASR